MYILGSVTCLLAVAMAIYSAVALYRAETSGRCARPFVLPVFVGVAYLALKSLEIHDAMSGGWSRPVVQAASQLIHTMLIVSVILLLHRPRPRPRRRGKR